MFALNRQFQNRVLFNESQFNNRIELIIQSDLKMMYPSWLKPLFVLMMNNFAFSAFPAAYMQPPLLKKENPQ